MTFSEELNRFSRKLPPMAHDVFVNVASAVKQSITDGSAVTGAPGQPVQTGNLKASWQLTFESPTEALIATNVEYAPAIEEGIARGGKPMHLRSQVGGFHSVALSAAGLQRICDDEARKLGAG